MVVSYFIFNDNEIQSHNYRAPMETDCHSNAMQKVYIWSNNHKQGQKKVIFIHMIKKFYQLPILQKILLENILSKTRKTKNREKNFCMNLE